MITHIINYNEVLNLCNLKWRWRTKPPAGLKLDQSLIEVADRSLIEDDGVFDFIAGRMQVDSSPLIFFFLFSYIIQQGDVDVHFLCLLR